MRGELGERKSSRGCFEVAFIGLACNLKPKLRRSSAGSDIEEGVGGGEIMQPLGLELQGEILTGAYAGRRDSNSVRG